MPDFIVSEGILSPWLSFTLNTNTLILTFTDTEAHPIIPPMDSTLSH